VNFWQRNYAKSKMTKEDEIGVMTKSLSMSNRRVLIVSYHFPPRPSIAALRIRGLAKYLPEHGWVPVILTAAYSSDSESPFNVVQTHYPGDAMSSLKRKIFLTPDKGFQEQIGLPRAWRGAKGKEGIVSKIIKHVKSIIAYPDDEKGWYPFAVSEADNLIKNGQFDALISSAAPYTCHLIAKTLKSGHDLPWIADFRDLWTQNHYYSYGLLRHFFEKKLELKTLSLADALVTVSDPLAQKLESLHKDKRVVTITNGFDSDDVATLPLTKEFSITYTGQIYTGKQDPKLLFQAISELIVEGSIAESQIRVRFLGGSPYWLEQEVKKYNLARIVEIQPRAPRDIALSMQRESHVLLLLNWSDPAELGVYTGKIFEYLAAQKPILAVGGPGGVVAELLNHTGVGVHVASLDKLKVLLGSWYQEYITKGRVTYCGNWDEVKKFSHREMARKFAELLNNVTRRL